MVFQIDNVTLIELVEARPCLWDKTNDSSKNKIVREKCWNEIFSFLETGYDEMSKKEKKEIGDIIIKKWTNIRDSFMKSLRTSTGQGFQKKYLYAENLNFLLKIADKADTDSNISETESIPLSPSNTPDLASTPEPSVSKKSRELPPPSDLPTKKRKTREPDMIEREILAELKKRSDNNIISAPVSKTPDEKETMLLSFLPYIKDMNSTEMMDLHLEMLTAIKKIKQKRTLHDLRFDRRLSSGNSTSSTSVPPSFINPQPTHSHHFPNDSEEEINDSNGFAQYLGFDEYPPTEVKENAPHKTINAAPVIINAPYPATLNPQPTVFTFSNSKQAVNETNDVNQYLPAVVNDNESPATINSQSTIRYDITQSQFVLDTNVYQNLMNQFSNNE